MKLLIINGSPHKAGTTALLTDFFVKGAKEKGHEIQIFHAAQENVHPCLGCDHCRNTSDGCVYKDSMEQLNPMLFAADVVVLVTPLYYFGMSAQIKAVIDRFYANNTELRNQKKQIVLLSACGDKDEWAMLGLKAQYECICKYMHWESIGTLYASGMYVREDLKNSKYLDKAYQLGLKI